MDAYDAGFRKINYLDLPPFLKRSPTSSRCGVKFSTSRGNLLCVPLETSPTAGLSTRRHSLNLRFSTSRQFCFASVLYDRPLFWSD